MSPPARGGLTTVVRWPDGAYRGDTFDRYDRDEIDKATYERQRERVRNDRAHQTALLEQANEHMDDAYLFFTAQRILELAQDAKTLWKSRSAREKRALLEELVSNPTLTGETVRFDLKKPFAVLAEMRNSANWHARVPEFRTALLDAATAA